MISNDKYKVIVRHSPGWREKKAATLGVSVGSPNWAGEKFAAILHFAAENFDTVRIDVSDALYRHNFMAEGLSKDAALARANALGALWLTNHQSIIDACPVKPSVIRWACWYNHPDFQNTLAAFENAYEHNDVFRSAVERDIDHFYGRKNNQGQEGGRGHSKNFLIEEVAVITLQARELPSLKIYPGDELNCLSVVRLGLVENAPMGLEQEQYAKIKFETRAAYKTPIPTYGAHKRVVANLL
jgi:tRNA-dependent cyclodipeptide synthase